MSCTVYLKLQNTVQSYEYALSLLQQMKTVGALPVRRLVTYAAGLAGNNHIVQKIMKSCNNNFKVTNSYIINSESKRSKYCTRNIILVRCQQLCDYPKSEGLIRLLIEFCLV